jgi:hypothetical protein
MTNVVSHALKSSLARAVPLLMFLVATPVFAKPSDRSGEPLSSLGTRAYAVLLDVFHAEEDWASIHAAEIIVELGRGESIREAMLRRMDRFEKAGTRVGAWRVMAMIPDEPARNEWKAKLERVFLDTAAVDRLQALESLAKVRHPLSGPTLETVARLASELADSDRVVLPLWAMAASGDLRALESLVGLLTSADVAQRRRSAYALRRLRPESAAHRSAVLAAFEREPHDTIAYPYLLCTALDLQLDPAKVPAWSKALRTIAATAAPKVRFEALQVLAEHYGPEDFGSLIPHLDDPDGDVRAGVALALLGIAGSNGQKGRQ